MPPESAGPFWIVTVMVLFLGAIAGAAIALMFYKAHILARAAKAEGDAIVQRAKRPLPAGPQPACVVFGVVDCDSPDGTAARVEIQQKVTNHSSRFSRWHTWDENPRFFPRRVEGAAFYLTTSAGETVFVEPSAEVCIAETLTTSYPIDSPLMRVRSASIRHGQHVYACGDLHREVHPRATAGSYREGSVGLVLRAPKGGRLLLSTNAVYGRYKERVHFLRMCGLVCSIVWVAMHACSTIPYLRAAYFATHETGELVAHKKTPVYGKHREVARIDYELTVRTNDGFEVTKLVCGETYTALVDTEEKRIPLLRVGQSTYSSRLGHEPSLPRFWPIVGSVIFVVGAFLLRLGYLESFAWYDRARLNEKGGDTRWEEPRPRRPVIGAPG
jgi:hypothetical protein